VDLGLYLVALVELFDVLMVLKWVLMFDFVEALTAPRIAFCVVSFVGMDWLLGLFGALAA
jgi:hypothetical protein